LAGCSILDRDYLFCHATAWTWHFSLKEPLTHTVIRAYIVYAVHRMWCDIGSRRLLAKHMVEEERRVREIRSVTLR